MTKKLKKIFFMFRGGEALGQFKKKHYFSNFETSRSILAPNGVIELKLFCRLIHYDEAFVVYHVFSLFEAWFSL